jgi:hypothetical protein
MSTQTEKEKLELLQGTLDLLILRTLIFGPEHGQGIARAILEAKTTKIGGTLRVERLGLGAFDLGCRLSA